MSRGDFLKKQLSNMTFMLDNTVAEELVAWANDGAKKNVIKIAHDSVTYSTVNNVAVIGIDGATYKKDVGGLCASVASYDQIYKYVEEANGDDSIDTILFRIDSPGGAVDGADELGELIHSSPKKTVTFYENRGQSAAIYYGSASNEMYASKTAKIGSIGVITIIQEPKDNALIVMSSSRAENKVCDLSDESCINRIQADIDRLESFFYERLQRNTGMTENDIEEKFGKGGNLYAEDAKKVGFLDGITTFSDLLKHLTKGEKMGKEKKQPEATKQPEVSASDIASRIQANINEVPVGMRGNSDVIAKATDPNTTVEAMKAFLWDMNEKNKTDEKQEHKKDNEIMTGVDGSSVLKDFQAKDDDEIEVPDEVAKELNGGVK